MNTNFKKSIFNPEDKLFERIETLYVPYEEKDNAKKQGAKWDTDSKCWVCDDKNELLIEKYKKRYIEVSYDDKDNAKENGCRWDFTNKKWYTYNSNQVY
jgi:hypothetical protein